MDLNLRGFLFAAVAKKRPMPYFELLFEQKKRIRTTKLPGARIIQDLSLAPPFYESLCNVNSGIPFLILVADDHYKRLYICLWFLSYLEEENSD